jgi:hypothetical protein
VSDVPAESVRFIRHIGFIGESSICELLRTLNQPGNPMSDAIQLLDVVALTEDVPDRGLVRGQVGTVVEDLGAGVFEVEFCDNDGRTYAMFALRPSD